ncbi:peptidase domain-containing ABC transporter [Flammeovirga kamogawensis]|uniref:Peptidase domain-containing ABC transporter n=1 Tax=Flammeovirga kamogawensis TaxID=373891 RepID=A0ABX8H593_9BACT|nr:peptidase domain-containing ABC transporter [Flammeovirga kamogawensis]MBB6463541.1 ATP-binding cassette subfamily B protein [Flammeovirga kamogawensis]QWG10596.1 peptidase domain-containing ABC transporter [Flammeovirga kamogawensis]TRX63701.1 peptidase domain-containing ABC transporter [Flammeovirga kamogawensis]
MVTNSRNLKFFHQLQSTDCAAACLAMIVNFYGNNCDLVYIKHFFEFSRIGVSLQDILKVSKKIGLNSLPLKLTVDDLKDFEEPIILFWKQDHFVVLEKIKLKGKKTTYFLADPAYGKIKLDQESFIQEWKGDNEKGIGIYFEPNEEFEKKKVNSNELKSYSLFNSLFFKDAIAYVKRKKKKYLLVLFFTLIALSTNWCIPFIFQYIIDKGIISKDMNIVFYLLLGQFILFISGFISDVYSQYILSKVNFNLSILLKKKLLYKLMKLPINYFDTRLNTETLQRLEDQNKIQSYLTWKGIDFIFTVMNIVIFGSILLYFNLYIFCIYFILSIAIVFWVTFFLEKRKILEYALFLKQAHYKNKLYEFVMHMPEIKVNSAQKFIIKSIVKIQDSLNSIELRSLILNINQLIGVDFISKLAEMIVIGVCAFLIINQNMTLGTLLSISYILGQLSRPVKNIVNFIRDTQDTDIANKRIDEVYRTEEEDNDSKKDISKHEIEDIVLTNLNFKYPGNFNPFVLKNINIIIKKNNITAIVGASGCGKTTLLKLLLAYYVPNDGRIEINKQPLNEYNADSWRKHTGIVLQDGHVFSGTIKENIIFSEKKENKKQLDFAVKMACIDDFISALPMGYNTKIGNTGIQLSGGQKQRLLLARAIYKNPEILFLDEATSALDAANEKKIHDNLQHFFVNKTVIIVAHRLSTVKNADKILVIDNGEIVETGNHNSLVNTQGKYFNLIKNQLELGR